LSSEPEIAEPPISPVDACAPNEIAARVRDIGAAATAVLVFLSAPWITHHFQIGFEHSIANMYFFCVGLLLKTQPEVLTAGRWTPESLQALSVAGALRNLIPVTLGNIVGGAGLVGGMYWFVYLRHGARDGK
jgi:formate/nitrite transporter FocA (FNT family)